MTIRIARQKMHYNRVRFAKRYLFFTVERIDMVVAYGRRRYVSAATSVEQFPITFCPGAD